MTDKNTIGLARRADKARSGLLFELEHGRFATDERLPSERDLAGLLGVSRTTLRKAIADLIRQGQIEQRHGFGTFPIRKPRATASGDDKKQAAAPVVQGLGIELLQRGDASSSRDLSDGVYLPRADEAMMLDLDPQAEVRRITRLWLSHDDRPIAYEEIALPLAGRDLASPPAFGGRRMRRIRSGPIIGAAAAAMAIEENTIGLFIEERSIEPDGRCRLFTRLTRPIGDLDLTYVLAAAPIEQPRSA